MKSSCSTDLNCSQSALQRHLNDRNRQIRWFFWEHSNSLLLFGRLDDLIIELHVERDVGSLGHHSLIQLKSEAGF
uniref:Uncharacterized protein n=1 Tax=Onchocerca volvulus TaxID=6282 RepID=A0A8R1Y3C8_ONCVO